MKDRSYLATFSPCTLRKDVTFRATLSREDNKSSNPLGFILAAISQNPLWGQGAGRGRGGGTYKIESPFAMLYSVIQLKTSK